LAEAITAGAAYSWHRTHVSRGTLATVAAAAAAALMPGTGRPPLQRSPGRAFGPSLSAPCHARAEEGASDAPAAVGMTDPPTVRPVTAAQAARLDRQGPKIPACQQDSAAMSQDADEENHGCPNKTVSAPLQPVAASLSVARAQNSPVAGEYTSEARQSSMEPSVHGTDLVRVLQERGWTVKSLKERLPESISYGHIRLSLAHIGRLGLQPDFLVGAHC
jgi:hypothetical protein